eukprot:TRINITY_DN4536_c0_g1_i1.p1 TRINITY_DN4536_c0_g1~~TRINITY_DN4536_c0_g1_i1.p1  ORF type:complete len:395 (+),score=110.56 TRINITY_DN4536_c0_g1_i1:48-1232(+)
MAQEAYQEANALFVDELYQEALEKYTKAISLNAGNSADCYIKRSACQYKLKKYTDAVADASTGIKLDPSNINGHLRKGIACFYLDEFETAKDAFEAGLKIKPNPKESTFQTWIRKCDAEIEEEDDEDVEMETTSTQDKMETSVAQTADDDDLPPPLETAAPSDSKMETDTPAKTEPVNIIKNPDLTGLPVGDFVIPKKERVSHTWYQSNEYIHIDFKAAGLRDRDVDIEYQDNAIEVSLTLEDSVDWVYDKVLGGKIVPKECSYTVTPHKVELKLKKEKAEQWTSLEAGGGAGAALGPKHMYPSSKGAKNWDKIAAGIPDEKLEGEQALNSVFQQIFKNGSEEQRRAMIKSFTESDGTVLSTNWDEVGQKKVDGSPPKGMEKKSWKELSHGKDS